MSSTASRGLLSKNFFAWRRLVSTMTGHSIKCLSISMTVPAELDAARCIDLEKVEDMVSELEGALQSHNARAVGILR